MSSLAGDSFQYQNPKGFYILFSRTFHTLIISLVFLFEMKTFSHSAMSICVFLFGQFVHSFIICFTVLFVISTHSTFTILLRPIYRSVNIICSYGIFFAAIKSDQFLYLYFLIFCYPHVVLLVLFLSIYVLKQP